MIALWLTACLVAHPRQCREFHPFRRPESMIECMTATQIAAAEWAKHHPNWRVTRIVCQIGKPELHA